MLLTPSQVFTRWANTHLDERDLAITGLLDGSLEDGIMLWNLLEEISGKKLTKIDNNPKMRIHKINNLVTSIKFVEDEGIKLVGIGAESMLISCGAPSSCRLQFRLFTYRRRH